MLAEEKYIERAINLSGAERQELAQQPTRNAAAWDAYLQSHPRPEYADLVAMVTERRAEISGNTLAFFQNIEFLTGLMGLLGHRRRDALPPEAAAN